MKNVARRFAKPRKAMVDLAEIRVEADTVCVGSRNIDVNGEDEVEEDCADIVVLLMCKTVSGYFVNGDADSVVVFVGGACSWSQVVSGFVYGSAGQQGYSVGEMRGPKALAS